MRGLKQKETPSSFKNDLAFLCQKWWIEDGLLSCHCDDRLFFYQRLALVSQIHKILNFGWVPEMMKTRPKG